MKKALLIFGTLFAFQALAHGDLKLQFPQENKRYFLASTASEIGEGIAEKSKNQRAEALCQHLGYGKLVKASSTIIESELLKVNDLQDGEVIKLNLKKDYSYLYSYDHAVINDLHCAN